ncbi:hypothetical protein PVAP13_1NG115320 [Panicum virgatum]|uniref:Uncharacterized protein n=1 Tax=Panicum virgatum TaxID=38727 RepID=A0A8T0WVG0_PANVG|nr:hypothetical protein PVAP13_1NG115320 [Panicum virgatum]
MSELLIKMAMKPDFTSVVLAEFFICSRSCGLVSADQHAGVGRSKQASLQSPPMCFGPRWWPHPRFCALCSDKDGDASGRLRWNRGYEMGATADFVKRSCCILAKKPRGWPVA